MKILFVNACVREHSRTLLLARHLLSRIPAEVTEIRLEEESMEPLTKERLAMRDCLLAEGKWKAQGALQSGKAVLCDHRRRAGS